ncbi:hypothetical protein [Enterococcus gilvus]|uniref:Uncharacterized protein n=1 Tax=Enterococcus gilvus ATCC BAA-350 TaxID=1158614 RepID=R2VKT8_9ENTE|nr:hypothetical protein [Enterococcus gilvus]EOI58281.1 hypothetical protein UKC_00353 [Enterococcus gilvus ATCC BAA-350]EOW78957.1 hypothetical protein I592_03095 [Enterococcus gilvus ATCC BAA-350]OJG40999.1 hypothetical protein RV02_GL001343 [Enterococcus gilvus]
MKMTATIKVPEAARITDAHRELVERARQTLLDKQKATPIALLGTQPVVGMYYWILCEVELPDNRGETLTVYKIYQSPRNEVALMEAKAYEYPPSTIDQYKISA